MTKCVCKLVHVMFSVKTLVSATLFSTEIGLRPVVMMNSSLIPHQRVEPIHPNTHGEGEVPSRWGNQISRRVRMTGTRGPRPNNNITYVFMSSMIDCWQFVHFKCINQRMPGARTQARGCRWWVWVYHVYSWICLNSLSWQAGPDWPSGNSYTC